MTKIQGRLLIVLSCAIVAGLFVLMAVPDGSAPRDEVSMRVASEVVESSTTTSEVVTTTTEGVTTTTVVETTTTSEPVVVTTTTVAYVESPTTTATLPPPNYYSAALTIDVIGGEEPVMTGAGYPDRYVDISCSSSVPGGTNYNPDMSVHLEGVAIHNYLYTFSGTGYEGLSVNCNIVPVGVSLSHSGPVSFSSDLAITAQAN